ncbi:MAG: aldehyde dehydrogenase family protein, partial [Natronomonas sp.]
SDVGSLIDGEHLSRVQSHVADAVEAGATVHTGGSARPDVGPHYYEPTILTGLPEGTRPACEEAFGPVVAVYPVDSAAEAIERANDTRYGLNASVWSADRERALSVAREIEAGTVNVNETYKAAWAAYDAPMGGMKDSGLGRRHGREGLYRYTEPKTISASRVGGLGDVPPGIPKRLFNAALWTVADARRRLSRWSNR